MVCRVMLAGKSQDMRGKVMHWSRRASAPMYMTSGSSRRKRATTWGAKRKPRMDRARAAMRATRKKKWKASRTRPYSPAP